jgi:hypothetical protein
MKEHGVGYYYSDGTMLRVDAEVIHKEAAVKMLRAKFEIGTTLFLWVPPWQLIEHLVFFFSHPTDL